MRVDAININAAIQYELNKRQMSEVTAVQAARWLDKTGVLRDSTSRRGLSRAGFDGGLNVPLVS